MFSCSSSVMMLCRLPLLMVISASSSAISLKLPLLIASTKAQFSRSVNTQETSILFGNAATSIIHSNFRSDELVNLQDAEELCSGILTELYVRSCHRDRHKTSNLDASIIACHARLMTALGTYASSVTAGCRPDKYTCSEVDDLLSELGKIRNSMSDIKRLLRSKGLLHVLREAVSNLHKLFAKVDKSESDFSMKGIAALEIVLAQPIDQSIREASSLISAFKKLMILQFQAEMMHLRILQGDRHFPQDRVGIDLMFVEATIAYKRSFAAGTVFGRRLDLLRHILCNLVGGLRNKFVFRGHNDPIYQLLDRLVESAANQEAYVGLLYTKLPRTFPLKPNKARREEELALIRSFIARFHVFSSGEVALALLRET